MADKIKLSKKVRRAVCNRHQYLQGSWNYERMQNGGWCYSMIPAIKALYKDPEDQKAALNRHLEFYNTHPYVSAPSSASRWRWRRSARTGHRSTMWPSRASRWA